MTALEGSRQPASNAGPPPLAGQGPTPDSPFGKRAVHRLGELFFRYRSFTPVPLALLLIVQARVSYPAALWGLALMFGGEWIRLASVRAAGKATRTRQVGAKQLVTWGLYAYTRNPLYIGNFLVWTGAVLFAGGPYLPWLLGAVFIMFFLQYTLIISLEEATLTGLFGAAYASYRQAVPRVIPRLRRAYGPAGTSAEYPIGKIHPWRYAVESERSTLQGASTVILLAVLSTLVKP